MVRLVQGDLSGWDVQLEPGRFLPLQTAAALSPGFSHAIVPAPHPPAAHRKQEHRKTLNTHNTHNTHSTSPDRFTSKHMHAHTRNKTTCIHTNTLTHVSPQAPPTNS